MNNNTGDEQRHTTEHKMIDERQDTTEKKKD